MRRPSISPPFKLRINQRAASRAVVPIPPAACMVRSVFTSGERRHCPSMRSMGSACSNFPYISLAYAVVRIMPAGENSRWPR
jgi:hypothetical protein